jgi:hypothetical protein
VNTPRLSEVWVFAADLQEAVAAWRDASSLEATVSEAEALITLGDVAIHIFPVPEAGDPSPNIVGMFALTLVVDDLDSMVTRLHLDQVKMSSVDTAPDFRRYVDIYNVSSHGVPIGLIESEDA